MFYYISEQTSEGAEEPEYQRPESGAAEGFTNATDSEVMDLNS